MLAQLFGKRRSSPLAQIRRTCYEYARIVGKLARDKAAVAQPGDAYRQVRTRRDQIGKAIRKVQRNPQFRVIVQ
ncbi:hypothetical protein D3C71_1627330 [compost metagenome]